MGLVAQPLVLVDMEVVLETWLPAEIDEGSMVKVGFDMTAGYCHKIEIKP